ncbi:MAG: hypothetical protein VX293_08790, partial [Candidatus Latescibacterota bacterium]|nr:hypothetical protein [Candidatus Latescibacterota bacterium]
FTMSLGFVIGTSLLLFSTLPALIPYCPDIILHSNFYHVNFFLVLIYAAILLISSHFRSAPKPEDLAFMQPTIAEQQQRAATLERVGVLGSFKFWFVVYICGFVGVYLLF